MKQLGQNNRQINLSSGIRDMKMTFAWQKAGISQSVKEMRFTCLTNVGFILALKYSMNFVSLLFALFSQFFSKSHSFTMQ